jgi:hypothetical protein
MEVAARFLRGETVPRRIELPSTIIDAANCAEWDQPYAARRQPDWHAALAACCAQPGPDAFCQGEKRN